MIHDLLLTANFGFSVQVREIEAGAYYELYDGIGWSQFIAAGLDEAKQHAEHNTMLQFMELLCLLSPEQLSQDGELSAAEVEMRLSRLMQRWSVIERQAGRTVTQSEVAAFM